MNFFADLIQSVREQVNDAREFITEKYNDLVERVTDSIFNLEADDDEDVEFTDEEIEIDTTPNDLLLQAEEQIEISTIVSELETLEQIETISELEPSSDFVGWEYEQSSTEINLPKWLPKNIQDELLDDFGIYDWNDLSELDKNFTFPEWKGFEAADEPASEIDTTEINQFRDEMSNQLAISSEQMAEIGDDDLMILALMADESGIGLAHEFTTELEPEDIAAELDLTFRGDFIDIESLLNSKMWEFIQERPDLFQMYTFYDDDGDYHIEIYENDYGE